MCISICVYMCVAVYQSVIYLSMYIFLAEPFHLAISFPIKEKDSSLKRKLTSAFRWGISSLKQGCFQRTGYAVSDELGWLEV